MSRPPQIRRITAILAMALGLAAMGCASSPPGPSPEAWTPPRSGLVTHPLAAAAEQEAGRGDARLGYPPRAATSRSWVTIDQRSNQRTTSNGDVKDTVRRATRTTTIVRPR